MISAVLLAAGRATRFGQCKQLVPVDGKPLLQHALDHLRASNVDHVVIVLGAHADEIRDATAFDGEHVVVNPDFADGISTSIRAGLRALPDETEAALIVLGDQPYVSPRTINALIDEFRRTHAEVIVPTFNGQRGNPVIVNSALFPEMMQIRGDIGCRSLFGRHEVAKLAVDDRDTLTDIDTPEDLHVA
jgi:molybdenum cofactor cytidylyltransferase